MFPFPMSIMVWRSAGVTRAEMMTLLSETGIRGFGIVGGILSRTRFTGQPHRRILH